MMHLVLLTALALTPRPASLDIVADCGATADDGTDDTLAIRACIEQEPRVLVIPLGVFDVKHLASNKTTALPITTSDTVVTGLGVGSVVRLIRDEFGFSGGRIFGVAPKTGQNIARVTIRNLTIDGGRPGTCLEAKHTPGSDPGDGRGQQQFGVIIGGGCVKNAADELGCLDTASDITVENVNFTGLSGDAVYLYNNVDGFRLEGQTLGGWCRAAIAMNAYEHCDQHTNPTSWDEMEATRVAKGQIPAARPFVPGLPKRGLRNVVVNGNLMVADPTATQSSRAIDVEPNARVCSIDITGNRLDQVEAGGVVGLLVERNIFATTGDQLGGSLALVRVEDAVVRSNVFRPETDAQPPLYLRIMTRTKVYDNDIRTALQTSCISLTNNGIHPSVDAAFRGNSCVYTGPLSDRVGIYTTGLYGILTATENTVIGYRDALSFRGGDDVLVQNNYWDVVRMGVSALSETPPMGTLTIGGNRGHADIAYWLQGAAFAGEVRDCGGSTTGRRLPQLSPLTPCSPAAALTQASIDDHELRLQALEAAP